MERRTKQGVFTYMGEEINFNYYTFLRSSDKVKFIQDVTNTVIVGDNYYSVIKDLIFDCKIIDEFTDIIIYDIIGCEKDELDVDKIEEFLIETNVIDIIKANVIPNVIEELEKAVDDNIAYRTGIHKNPIVDSLSDLLKTVELKVSEVDTESIMEMAQVISKMSGELTVDKMLEAYTNSDIFKQRSEQMIADKEEENAKITSMVTTVGKKKATNKK